MLLLEHGKVALSADEPQVAVNRYFALAKTAVQPSGIGGVEIRSVGLSGSAVIEASPDLLLQQGQPATLKLELITRPDIEQFSLHVQVADQAQTALIIYLVVDDSGRKMQYGPGVHRIELDLGSVELNSGRYSLQIGAEGMTTGRILYLSRDICPFTVVANHNHWAKIVRHVVPLAAN